MTRLEQLHAVQALDSAVDQLRYKREHLAERAALTEVRKALAGLRTAQAANQARQQELDAQYAAVERASAELDARAERLQAKLKTVVITREAEALQKEIAAVRAEREAGDEHGLLLLDEAEQLGAEATRLDTEIAQHQATESAAREALAEAEAAVDAELAEVAARRAEAAAAVSAELLARYEELRPLFQGVAVARLQGSRCTGCHLDLSRVEVEAVRAAAASPVFPECPQCGRLLVV